MSTPLIIFIGGMFGALLALAAALIGEARVTAFGERVTRWADGAHHGVRGLGERVVGALLVLVAFILLSVVAFVTEPAGEPPPWSSEKTFEEYASVALTFLKWLLIAAGGVLGLSAVAAVIFSLLWVAVRVVGAIPLTPPSVAIIAFIVAVAFCVAGLVAS